MTTTILGTAAHPLISGRRGRGARLASLLACTLLSAVPLTAQSPGAAGVHVDEEGSPLDPIAVLQQQIDAGEASLEFDDRNGYLVSLLEALDISVATQGLIFSRTSLQTNLITPWTPRAVYYNDDVYIGWVQDSPIIEIASIDPDDGGVFYTLEQNPEGELKFVEEGTTCLMCHESRSVTDGIAGVMVRSVLVDRFGYPIAPLHEGSTSDRTDFDRRFAGWYVTGTHEGGPHAGNAYAPVLSHEVSDVSRYLQDFDVNADGNVVDLAGRFDSEPYLSSHSDIVSLMVLTHQTRVHNLMVVAHEAAKEAVGGGAMLRRITSGGIPTPAVQSAAQVRIDGAVERLVRAMMFSREAPLRGRVTGTSGFSEEFEDLGPFDESGRSLRHFDLERRLFKYPMSFLIYSDAFETLPRLVKEPFYRRVVEVLDGRDMSGEFDHVNSDDRAAVRDILMATKPEFREFVEDTVR